MITAWGDAKRYIAEDIVIYSAAIIIDLSWDLIVNFAASVHLLNLAHNPQGYPYHFGIVQSSFLIFAIMQWLRKIRDWRYYE